MVRLSIYKWILENIIVGLNLIFIRWNGIDWKSEKLYNIRRFYINCTYDMERKDACNSC